MSLFSLTITLFFIMNSVGSIEALLAILLRIPKERQVKVLLREMIFALVLMMAFHVFGEILLEALGIGPQIVQIAGGFILFLIAIKMIFGSSKSVVDSYSGEPYIVPIATPMIAGPSILATIMVYAYYEDSSAKVLVAILIAWILSLAVYGIAIYFRRHISDKFLSALERLAGLILTMLAVEMTLHGIKEFIGLQGGL